MSNSNNNNNNNNANNINNTFNIKQHSQLQFDSKGLKGWMGRLYIDKISGPINELLDNARDAAREGNLQNATCIIKYSSDKKRPDVELLSITNYAKNILSMDHILKFASSGKDSTGFTVGENGVGTLQACNILSKVSLIITTRNERDIDIGVIPNTNDVRVYICHLTYYLVEDNDDSNNEQGDDKEKVSYVFEGKTDNDIKMYQYVKEELKKFGVNVKKQMIHVVNKLHSDARITTTTTTNNSNGSSSDNIKADLFHLLLIAPSEELENDKKTLKDVKNRIIATLPTLYLGNVKIKFYVNRILIKPMIWQRKLAELSRFSLESPRHVDIYLGFDPALAGKKNNTAMMYLYSAGRLIERKKDPRKVLNVPFTGSSYMSGLTLIVDDRGIGKQRYFQPNPTKENIQELDAKLENLNDIGLIFKAFYSYHYKPFTQYENPLVWFRDAIIKCKRMTGLQSDEDEALAFQDIKTLKLNSFNIQKRVCRGTKIICINANSYKHGRDCLCTIRRPPVEAKKKPVQNKRKKGSNSNGSTNKKRKKFVSTSDEESASDESSEMSDSDSDDDYYDSTSSGGQKVADIPQNKSTTARRRQSSNNLNSNDDITIARLQNLNQNLSDRNKALNKANEELLKEIELLKSNTNDEQLLAQNATLKKRLEKETKTFNSVKAQLSNQNATHTSRIHELELQLKNGNVSSGTSGSSSNNNNTNSSYEYEKQIKKLKKKLQKSREENVRLYRKLQAANDDTSSDSSDDVDDSNEDMFPQLEV